MRVSVLFGLANLLLMQTFVIFRKSNLIFSHMRKKWKISREYAIHLLS